VSIRRNGAHYLLKTAQAMGAEICFANPGTTELTLVRALDDLPGIRPVLGLFEGVCTGAADGYARVSGKPALTLLHLGPGFANGIANLHNARRAMSPVVNIIGDHATWHLPFDAPLTSDIDSLARPVSKEVVYLRDGPSLQAQVKGAFEHALGPVGAIVTLVAPTDVMDAETAEGEKLAAVSPVAIAPRPVGTAHITECLKALPETGRLVILLGADALAERGQRAAARIAEGLSARLLMESYPAIVPLGGDLPRLERLAYFPQDVQRQLEGATVLLAGAKPPVSYFGYEGQPSVLVPPDRLICLSQPGQDGVAALEALADRIEPVGRPVPPIAPAPAPARGPALAPADVVDELVELLPENAIISLEGSTFGGPYLPQAPRARRHRVMTNTGGAIGQGLPCAVGAALAAPGARIVALQSDGSAHYTLQALWTMAREKLPVTIIIAANHRYGILQTELTRSGADLDQPVNGRLTRLDNPRADWVALAQGYGVPGIKINTRAEFREALGRGFAEAGPFLIQAELS
jgi:acetolactate synthase-1/2/3 large subunit